MYFVGMLVFELCMEVNYDWYIILVLMLFGVGVVWVVLWFLIINIVFFLYIVFGGVLVGVGIGVMYYIGMVVM